MKDGNVFKQELLWSFFFNWEVTRHYQLVLAIIWVIPFFKLLHWIICSKNKNIGNIWQEVSCFIYIKDRYWFMQEVFLSLFSQLGNYRTLPVRPYQFLLKTISNIAFLKLLYWIICLKNKIIWNIWQEVSSLDRLYHMITGDLISH